jgi:hypothetical protein
LFRDYNANYGITVDISGISLFGPSTIIQNYYISKYATSSGVIYPKYVQIFGNDKIYDATTEATLTISGLISDDLISYIANFNDKYADINKLITAAISLSGQINYNTYTYNFNSLTSNTNLWSI